jgi:hypothetical protein
LKPYAHDLAERTAVVDIVDMGAAVVVGDFAVVDIDAVGCPTAGAGVD